MGRYTDLVFLDDCRRPLLALLDAGKRELIL